MRIDTTTALEQLGWQSSGTALIFNCGELGLVATESWSANGAPVVICLVTHSTSHFVFELPRFIDSPDQLAAWIAWYCLRNSMIIDGSIPWLEEGQANQHLLPWIKKRLDDEARRAAEPWCHVEREWFRVARKKLTALAEVASDDDLVAISCTDALLNIVTPSELVAMPAQSANWNDARHILLKHLVKLPKRLSQSTVSLRVFDQHLTIAGLRLPLAPPPNPT